MMDQRWKVRAKGQVITINLVEQSVEIVKTKKATQRMRPWTSWPSPGIKKLTRAAITLPDSPRREGLAALLMVREIALLAQDTREMGLELEKKRGGVNGDGRFRLVIEMR